ncbi:hypothetical protein [Jannaschia aquimarina]|uniref:Uncharacterized protein n=1 Tax=Jannaschia aquimarina TaxID=935700 RepID=A0A0D1ELF4_9RHOB|nr:hypothetical protein [Jannaschia aquimarina]KIT16605.1 hypothetical protein jaqu_16490 [Jannaschia aquimarina]SNT44316.1 hypothetical protein SAMN05421775_1274 [Jannaschia aquimarina]
MKTILTIPALALVLAGPVAAQQVAPGAAGAIAHFNQDRSGNDVISLDGLDGQPVAVSTRSGLKAEVFAHFNQDLTGNEVIRVDNATLYSGQPTYGADIFEAIRAEDD